MENILKHLIELQRIDTQFDELQLQKGDLPIAIEETRIQLKEKQERKEHYEERLESLAADRRMFENEIAAGKEKLKEYEDKLYQVKTNREYDAISLEIDTKKNEIEELKKKIDQSLEEETETLQLLEEVTAEIAEIEKQLAEYEQELKEIEEQTKEQETRLKHEREKIVREIDPRYIRQYERIRQAKNGLAVVPIRRNSCGGCFSAIPPQKIIEIREMHRLYTCEHCGRILVWIDEEH